MPAKPLLMIPGPTPCPDVVLRAMAEPMINHRGPEYAALQNEVVAGVKEAYQTSHDLLIFPASGTGGLEAAIVNTLSPGDRVLAVPGGAFGERFATIAASMGVEVSRLEVEWGSAVRPAELADRLAGERAVRAVLLTHNETSTGALTDLQAAAAAVRRANRDVLILVDTISGVLTAELRPDDWDLDVVVAGSQKAWMVPPGLTFLSVSPRAWQASREARLPRFYFDFAQMQKWAQKGQTPYTPAVSLLRGLRAALPLILEEGIPACIARHQQLGAAVRAGVTAMGLELFANPACYSNAVTAIRTPGSVRYSELKDSLRRDYDLVIAGAPSRLEGSVFRIGHLGYVSRTDVLATLAALESSLRKLGLRTTPGAAVGAAAAVFEAGDGS
jgi:aspartate aminotransferase-like enzyme